MLQLTNVYCSNESQYTYQLLIAKLVMNVVREKVNKRKI